MSAPSHARSPRTRTFMPLALLAAVVMTCLQGAAFAGAVPMSSTHRTTEISTSGLDLVNPANVARLDTRIRNAARRVCAPASFHDLAAMADRPACEKAAIASALAKRDILVARAQADQLAARAQPGRSTD